MTRASSTVVPPGIKRWVTRLVRAYHQTLYPFTAGDLQRALVKLGVQQGDAVMVHSAFDRFLGFSGGPVEVIRTLQQVVGPHGTLMMPTIPFRGTAVEYALGDPVFDAQQTVSRMGLITELFRRFPGVVRSIHPTHSVAVWGNRAETIASGHERAETPCGRATPYGKLLECNGKILLAGVSASTMTFAYFVAEDLSPRFSLRVLTDEKYPLRWKDKDGSVRVAHVRLFTPGLDHDLTPLVHELKRRHQWHERRVGGLRLMLVRAQDAYDAAANLVERGLFLRPAP